MIKVELRKSHGDKDCRHAHVITMDDCGGEVCFEIFHTDTTPESNRLTDNQTQAICDREDAIVFLSACLAALKSENEVQAFRES